MRRPSPRLLVCAALLALGACQPAQDDAAPAASEPEPTAAAATLDPAILAHPARSEDNRYRDAGFKPLEVYEFFGIEPGMVVGDLMPSRGYHTTLLSQIVGDDGRVVAILRPRPSSEESVERSRGFLAEALEPFGFTNVEMIADPSQIADDSLDVILTVRNYHDLGEGPDRVAALPEYLRILKPGGIFAAIDAHTDKPDERDESVHRINADLARSEITSAGFEFVGASEALLNPDDTFDFDGRERAGSRGATEDAPIHRYYISRWVHKYRKPTR